MSHISHLSSSLCSLTYTTISFLLAPLPLCFIIAFLQATSQVATEAALAAAVAAASPALAPLLKATSTQGACVFVLVDAQASEALGYFGLAKDDLPAARFVEV